VIRLTSLVPLNRATSRRLARPNQHLHPVVFSAGSKIYSAAQSRWRLRNLSPIHAKASTAKAISAGAIVEVAVAAVIRATTATISRVIRAMNRKANAASKAAAAVVVGAGVAAAIATIVADHNPKASRVAARFSRPL
jgi:hypothetical protein